MREDEGGVREEGGGERKVEEEVDVTRDMPNPVPVPKVEEVPPQAISREGEGVRV